MPNTFSAADFGNSGAPKPDAVGGPWSAEDFAPTKAPTNPMTGAANDSIWSSMNSARARVLDAMGYGAKQGWGSEPLGLSADTEKFFRQTGLFRDYEDGHQTFLKAFNDATIRPVTELAIRSAAAAGSVALRGIGSAISTVGYGAEQTAQEIQGSGDSTLRSAAALPFGAISEQAGRIATGGGLESGILGIEAGFEAAIPANIRMAAAIRGAGASEAAEAESILSANRARAAGVVGEGEAGFYEATPPTPENIQARTAAAAESGLDQVPQPMPPAPDIHELARRVDPVTFERYDALALERDTARGELARLSDERAESPEIAAAQEKVDSILAKVNGVEDRLTKVQSERLTAARDDLDQARTVDTPEMADVRKRLMGADFEMRDMAPQVTEAYRHAADMLPEDAIEAVAEAKTAEKSGAPEKGATGAKEAEAASEAAEQPETRAIPIAAAQEATPGVAPPNVLGEQTLGEPGAANEGQAVAAAEGTTEATKPTGRPTTANMKSVEGTGELKTRSLAEGVEAKAIEDGLTEAFGDLPEYRTLSMAEQAQGVSKLIAEDYERAKAVAMGERQPPKGLLPESVFVGVEKHALATGDVETLRQLGTRSRLATAATTMGQRIRALGERDKASPVGLIQDVQTAREAALKAKNIDIEAEKASIASEIKAEMKKAATVKADAWADFVAAIKCGEA